MRSDAVKTGTQQAPGITVNDETHGQLKQLSVCLFFYAAGTLQQFR